MTCAEGWLHAFGLSLVGVEVLPIGSHFVMVSYDLLRQPDGDAAQSRDDEAARVAALRLEDGRLAV